MNKDTGSAADTVPLDPTAPASRATRPAGDQPSPGIALCLSGGGYRAMLFHAGALWRLNEAGLLPKLSWVSSVSGGSITAGVLGRHWSRLMFGTGQVASNFVELVVNPLRAFAATTADLRAIFYGLLTPGQVARELISCYRSHLFGHATLQDLPDSPRFLFNASSLQTGVLWRFCKSYMADYRVGQVRQPDLPLAQAVAASSAFPPFLSPVYLNLRDYRVEPTEGADLHVEPYITRAVLSDGGIYDNLGLETAWKRYRDVLVSDGGQRVDAQGKPWVAWLLQLLRVTGVIDNQVRSLRKRNLIHSYEAKDPAQHRNGCYWGIATPISKYGLSDAMPCPETRTCDLAAVPTRLAAMGPRLQERLINWGYAVCDAALRCHYIKNLPVPPGFPYPEAKV